MTVRELREKLFEIEDQELEVVYTGLNGEIETVEKNSWGGLELEQIVLKDE